LPENPLYFSGKPPLQNHQLLFIGYSSYAVAQRNENMVQPNPIADSAAVMASIDNFIEAFTSLNWKEFSQCFADDATAFFPPSAKFPYRANNKKEVEKIFRSVFENARKQKSSPPYIQIQPKDLKIQLSNSIAIVTFLLEDPDSLGRRTLVLRKENTRWLIVHLHASGVEIP
jgi:ketosteroid isomerase-like protein